MKCEKSSVKVDFSAVVGVLCVALVLVQIGCQNKGSSNQPKIDTGDEALAKAKLAEAESLYEGRADLAKARLAVAVLRQAQVADYGNYEVAWKLARAAYFVGDRTENDDESEDMFRLGTEAGQVAVKLKPDRPDGHFWLGANLGGTAENSTLASLANVQDIKREMEAVISIDESYQGGSAYLGLGRLYLKAPRVLGGDVSRAIEYLEKGLKFGVENSQLRYQLAEAYQSAGREAEARKQIEVLMAINPDPNYIAEHSDAVSKAKKLLQKLDAT